VTSCGDLVIADWLSNVSSLYFSYCVSRHPYWTTLVVISQNVSHNCAGMLNALSVMRMAWTSLSKAPDMTNDYTKASFINTNPGFQNYDGNSLGGIM
jgi:hypothetical protein